MEIPGKTMNSIVKDATDLRDEAEWRADAHDHSAKWHRKWGVRLGVAATILSAIVGIPLFAIAVGKLGLDVKGNLPIPPAGVLAQVLFYTVIISSVLSPVLGALQASLNEPARADKHITSSAGYERLKDRLNSFLEQYEQYKDENLQGTQREDAQKEKDSISEEMRKLKTIIGLTANAEEHAKERLRSSRNRKSS